jgi:hypothetical protein
MIFYSIIGLLTFIIIIYKARARGIDAMEDAVAVLVIALVTGTAWPLALLGLVGWYFCKLLITKS